MSLQKNKAESKFFNFDLELNYLKRRTLLHDNRLYVFMHNLLFVFIVSNQCYYYTVYDYKKQNKFVNSVVVYNNINFYFDYMRVIEIIILRK